MESEIGLEISESTDIDLLVCGSCKRSFQLANILGFMKHKKFDCEDPGSVIDPNNKVLLCQACRQKFNTPWSLLKHAQNVHFLRIYLEQNYHVPSVSVEEEPKSAASSVDDGNYSSPVIEYANQQPKTLQHCTLPNEAPTESMSLISKNISEHVAYMAPVDAASEEIVKSESESINKEVINTLAISSKEKPKVDDVTQSDQVCCDNQDCGISVMPGTHESLKRCCSAVVPKKRKRHMEIKHRMNLLSRMRRQKNRSSSPASIVIDVTPDSQGAEDREHSATEQGSDQSVSRMMIHAEQHPSNKTNSVIIQPGSTFTIPLSFAMSNSSQTVTVVDSDSVHGSGSLMPSCLRLPSSFELTSLPQSLVPTETSNTVSQPATLMPASQTIEQPVSLKKESDADKAGTPNILQGILAQMFSEKTITVPRMMPSSVETAVPHPLVGLKQEAGLPDQCEETSNSQASVGHSLHSKKRRYPTSRPYKCDQCDDAFNQRIHLKKHQSKHTGIKPFKCDQCDYATVERSHLKVHIRVHTGEKPFKCTYCEYATAQRSTLKIHLKRHHSTTDHCLTCSRRDHTQCYPVIKQSLQVLPPSSNNNNFVPASPFISPPGGNSTDDKKPENTSLQTTVSNVDNEK